MFSENSHIEFTKRLIKGKIAEIIFEQMFRETGKYTILRFGYEYTLPELAQYKHLLKMPEVLENIDDSPDFVLLSEDKSEVYLVETKYRSILENSKIQQIAQKLIDRWHSPFLFVASKDAFYFAPCSVIAKEGGHVGKLSERWVPAELQSKYLALLNHFELKNPS